MGDLAREPLGLQVQHGTSLLAMYNQLPNLRPLVVGGASYELMRSTMWGMAKR